MPKMEALVFTFAGEGAPPWMPELADEFIEDPHCRLVLLGTDPEDKLLITIWESEMAVEVEQGLAEFVGEGVRLRRMKVIDPRNPTGLL
jgi:hypothetical protein